MARFDWPRFLRSRGIEYVTSGPNTARGHISVRCPWCGESDPSQHLGISLKGHGWGCLRNSAHRGKSVSRLVQGLLGCSPEEARRVAGVAEVVAPTLDALAESYAALRGEGVGRTRKAAALKFPPEFKPLLDGSKFSGVFVDYLTERGYRGAQVRWLAENYNLKYAVRGSFAYRVILPVYDRYSTLVSWTGRTVIPDASPRYKTLRVRKDEDDCDDPAPVALAPTTDMVLGLPVLWSAVSPRALVVVEGPFDALKLSAFGHPHGLFGTCLFGLNAYPAQTALLLELSQRFEGVYLLLDEDAELQRLRLMSQLAAVSPKALKMPKGTDDPGAMSGAEVARLAASLWC